MVTAPVRSEAVRVGAGDAAAVAAGLGANATAEGELEQAARPIIAAPTSTTFHMRPTTGLNEVGYEQRMNALAL